MGTRVKIAIVIVGLVCAIGIAFAVGPSRAKCYGCFDGTCFGSAMCGPNCVCLKQGLDTQGRCFSVN